MEVRDGASPADGCTFGDVGGQRSQADSPCEDHLEKRMAEGKDAAASLAAAMTTARRANLINSVIMALNLVSVVGCVVLIKAVYGAPFNFRFANTTITIHFLCTATFVNIGALMKFFTPKRIPVKQYVQLSLAQVASVGFVNLSLYYNSVGMYQVLKFMNVPVICLVEYFMLSTSYSIQIYTALFAIVCGVTMTVVTEISFSALGFFFGVIGTVSTAIYQILNKHIQQTCEVNAMQLLQYESWFTAFWSFLWALGFDNVSQLLVYEWTAQVIILIALGGFCAFGVNLTCYLVIGRTSPVTYGVVGNMKTIAILVFGYMVLKQPFALRNVGGIAVAFCGVAYYTHLKLVEQRHQILQAVCEGEGK